MITSKDAYDAATKEFEDLMKADMREPYLDVNVRNAFIVGYMRGVKSTRPKYGPTPTVPGLYWARHPDIIGRIYVYVEQSAVDRNEFKTGSKWAGPYPEPEEDDHGEG